MEIVEDRTSHMM